MTVLSPKALKSITLRRQRPIRRWISCVLPFCLPREASLGERVNVADGSKEYSAFNQPVPLPRKKKERHLE